jgi:hypothetical protein
MRWAQFVASPGRLHCWIAPPQRQHRPLIRRFHTRCLNRPRRPFHREVRGRCSGQGFIEPFEEHDRPEGLRVSKRRRPCHRRTLRCPRICAVSRTGRIAPLNLSGLTAAQNVAIGPKRHFAATQHLVAFGSKADIDRRNVVARIGTRIALALRVRGRGHLEPNDFPVLGNSFPVFSPKIPCSMAQGNSAKEAGIPRQLSAADTATALVSRISLYFSLLAGNLGRRPVRNGLCRQPASTGPFQRSRGDLPAYRKTCVNSAAWRRDGQSLLREFRPSSPTRPLLIESLWSQIFNIRFLHAETRFDSTETG